MGSVALLAWHYVTTGWYLFMMLGSAALFGSGILGRLIPDGLSITNRVFLGTALGLGFLAYWVLGIAMLGQATHAVALGSLALMVGGGLVLNWQTILRGEQLVSLGRRVVLFAREQVTSLSTERILTTFPTGVLMVWFGALLVTALSPVYGADNLRHHFAIAEIIKRDGELSFMPVIFFNVPQNVEMLLTFGNLLYDHAVGMTLAYTLSVLVAVGIFMLAREFFEPECAILAAAIFSTTPMMATLSVAGPHDVGLMMFTECSMLCCYKWIVGAGDVGQSRTALRWLALCGMFAGFAAGTKYIGLYVVAGMGAVVVGRLLVRRSGGASVALVVFACAVGLAGSPWYVRNLVLTGNPVWPIFFHSLGGEGWNETAHAETSYSYLIAGLGRGLGEFLLGPVLILVNQPLVFDRGGIGPLYPVFLPLAVLAIRSRFEVHLWLLLFAGTVYTIWFQLMQVGRYLASALVLCTIPLAEGIRAAVISRSWLSHLARGVLVLAFAFQVGIVLVYASNFVPVVVGTEAKDEFLRRKTNFYDDILWMNQHLPVDAVVMETASSTMFYLQRKTVWGTRAMQGYVDYGRLTEPEDLGERLCELGVTHVFSRKVGANEKLDWGHGAPEVVDRFLMVFGRMVYTNPQGRVIRSMTIHHEDRIPVAVYEVGFPCGRGH